MWSIQRAAELQDLLSLAITRPENVATVATWFGHLQDVGTERADAMPTAAQQPTSVQGPLTFGGQWPMR